MQNVVSVLLSILLIFSSVGGGYAGELNVFAAPAADVAVPDFHERSTRTYVGAGFYHRDGSFAQSMSSAMFVVHKVLLPGRVQVMDPGRNFLRPHFVEVRLGNPGALLIWEMPVLAVVWDASGRGFAEFLAVARYTKGDASQFLGWTTYAIKGDLPIIDIEISKIFELIPSRNES